MIEIVLTREDANTEFALLTEWLVDDGAAVRKGAVVCVVETTKASLEVESPAAGTLVHLYDAGIEVELGRRIAIVAERDEEVAEARAAREQSASAARPEPTSRKATKKAVELAALHGIDLDSIDKQGFVTADDVEAVVASRGAGDGPAAGGALLAGIALDGVTLPASMAADESLGVVDPAFLAGLRADPAAFRALSSEEKCERYRAAGALVGDDVWLGKGTLVDAPRIVLEQGVRIGPGSTVTVEEVVAIGALSRFGPHLELACRRAYVGTGVHATAGIRIGGGGHRDPWAVFAIGDDAFIGDEAFVNVCRPVLIGKRVFLTMRSLIVTHNVGHSVLQGFENRFAPVVLEDWSQVGLGTVIYAGCRVGQRSIVGSNSYVVSDIPAGKLAIGVPAKVVGASQRALDRRQQADVARGLLDDLYELLAARGLTVSEFEEGSARGIELAGAHGPSRVVFVERLAAAEIEVAARETVVLTLDAAGHSLGVDVAVCDLVAETVEGGGGVVLESVREFCRKKGIKLSPMPWRYDGGLV
jgi:acetyltransferase-like isoleucine patch superfamily enzyme